MFNTSRGLRETAVRALAKVGLVWAVAVLAALFMTMSAQGQHDDDPAAASASHQAHHSSFSVSADDAPRTAGLALALLLLGGGAVVLAVGASRGDREVPRLGDDDADADDEPTLSSDLPLALGVSLLA